MCYFPHSVYAIGACAVCHTWGCPAAAQVQKAAEVADLEERVVMSIGAGSATPPLVPPRQPLHVGAPERGQPANRRGAKAGQGTRLRPIKPRANGRGQGGPRTAAAEERGADDMAGRDQGELMQQGEGAAAEVTDAAAFDLAVRWAVAGRAGATTALLHISTIG